MATITFTVSENHAAALAHKAQTQGLTLEEWFQQVAEREVPSASVAHLQTSDPEAWFRHLEEFVASLPKTPVLSDEAMSRESIYFGEE